LVGPKKFPHDPPPRRFGELPHNRGLVFICKGCTRPTAISRDRALKAWGEQGRIREVAARTRCPNCRFRGMAPILAPVFAELGSRAEIDRLVATLHAIKPSRKIG